MANPREEEKIQPSGNDPTPYARKGDARFLPVVVIAGLVLIAILIAAVVFIKGKGTKVVPRESPGHPTSSLVMPVR